MTRILYPAELYVCIGFVLSRASRLAIQIAPVNRLVSYRMAQATFASRTDRFSYLWNSLDYPA